jgi:FkbM family methyltransferase
MNDIDKAAERQANFLFTTSIKACDFLHRLYMRLVSYVSPVAETQTIFGGKLLCDSRDYIQRRIRFFGIYEHNLTFYMMSCIQAGDTVVDIGANIGYFSVLCSKLVGESGKVIAIEADPNTFKRLKENLQLNGCRNVESRNVAATEDCCMVNMHSPDAHNKGANTIVRQSSDAADGTPGMPFQNFVKSDIPRVKFIKIDIEGSEGPVLQQIINLLHALPDKLVIASEVSPSTAWCINALKKAGFEAFAISNTYTIDYYLIRKYLSTYGEGRFVSMIPVDEYLPAHSDYVFERRR